MALGAIMMGANAGLGLVNALVARKKQKEAALEAQGANLANRMKQDQFALEEFPEQGYDVQSFYQAYGGKLPLKAKGGNLMPMSSDMVDVVGPKHSQGGVNVGAAEVEGGETIKDGERVYSDQLEVEPGVTYADKAKQYANEKGELEKQLLTLDGISAGTAKRRIQILDAKEDKLFNQQEQSKMGWGGKMKKYADGGFMKSFMPYADNIVNAGLSFLTPKVPRPQYIKPRQLDTKINVNPQLNAISRAQSAAENTILNNTSNSAVARNTIARTRLQGSEQKANVLAQKENQETQLRNRNALFQQQTDQINAGKTDAFNQANMARSSAIISNISQNVANAGDDWVNAQNFKAQKDFNTKQLAALLASGDFGEGDVLMKRYKEILAGLKN